MKLVYTKISNLYTNKNNLESPKCQCPIGIDQQEHACHWMRWAYCSLWRGNAYHEETSLWKDVKKWFITGFGLVSGALGTEFKQSFALNCMLSGSRGNFVILIHLWKDEKLKWGQSSNWLKKKKQSTSLRRQSGIPWHFLWVGRVYVFVCIQSWLQGILAFVLIHQDCRVAFSDVVQCVMESKLDLSFPTVLSSESGN